MRYFSLLATAFLACLLPISAQPYRLSNHISVFDLSGAPFPYAWAGGSSSPQYSDIDLDLDGKKDLVVFDREGYAFTPFINIGQPGQMGYRFAPELADRFLNCACAEWALFEDFNCDGREDLFCGGQNGSNFKVYESVVFPGDSLGFVLRYDPLLSLYNPPPHPNPYLNLFQLRTDVPGIVDIDYDGDVDIVASQNASTRFALHRNMAVEELGRCDTLMFLRETSCWGYFTESDTSNDVKLGDNIFCFQFPRKTSGTSGGSEIHAGSSLLLLDLNRDSLMDALLGDISFRNAVALYNGGTGFNDSMVFKETSFPSSDSSIEVQLFPAFYYVDVNNDSVRDLIAAPNTTADLEGVENVNGSVLYLNEGRDDSADFRFQGRAFLSGGQIDAGSGSAPCFFDHNKDGLMDLLVGNLLAYFYPPLQPQFRYELHLYENIGTALSPQFKLITREYLNVQQLTPPLSVLAPEVGDLDGDGDADLLLGNGSGTVYFLRDLAASGQPAFFSLSQGARLVNELGQVIDAGSKSSPELFDIDGDGDLDLFIGNELGRISFYRNIGTPTAHSFQLISQTWGDIKVSNQFGNSATGFARPRFADYDGDGVVELLVGEESGLVRVFGNIASGATDSLPSLGRLSEHNVGGFAAPDAAPLDTFGLTWVVGNGRGGLMLLSSIPDSLSGPPLSLGAEQLPSLEIYPNPARDQLFIRWESPAGSRPAQVQVLSLLGQRLLDREVIGAEMQLDVRDWAAGTYFILIRRGEDLLSSRVEVRKD
jgi:hypothetical protein